MPTRRAKPARYLAQAALLLPLAVGCGAHAASSTCSEWRDPFSVEALRRALRRGDDPNCLFDRAPGTLGSQTHKVWSTPTYLGWAAREGHAEMVRELLRAGAAVDGRGVGGAVHEDWTPLMEAAYVGDLEVLRLLLAAGAAPHVQDRIGDSALTAAASECRDEAVDLLLRSGLRAQAARGKASALDRAIEGSAQYADDRGEACNTVVRRVTREGSRLSRLSRESALCLAASAGQTTTLDTLYPPGTKRPPIRWATRALRRAITAGRTTTATWLLAHGADPATRDSDETDLVRFAAGYGADILTALAAAGANLDRRDGSDGKTALAYYAGLGSLRSVGALLDGGAKIDAQSRDAMTALHIAARASDQAALSLLIERGATIDARDALGRTPLYYAVRACRADAVEALIAAGADVDAVDQFGTAVADALPRSGPRAHDAPCEERAQIEAALARR